MRRQIIVRIGGGLGNQLFEYAYALRIAQETNREVVFDLNEFFISKFFPIPENLRRKFELRAFEPKVRYLGTFRRIFYLIMWVLRKKCFPVYSFVLKICGIKWVDAPRDDVLDPSLLDFESMRSARTIYLSGTHCHIPLLISRERLQSVLSFPPLSQYGSRIARQIEESGSNSVSLHIRRTDYIAGGVCLDLSYYTRAIERLRELGSARFFVFSDDIEWSKAKLAIPDAVYVEGHWDTPWNDMHIMSLCHHHIIANSTFSWWAAYLSKSSGCTIYPNPWWKDSPIQETMIPTGWAAVPSL